MDCPKKFKGYCKYHNVEIEDDDPEFYRRFMRIDAVIFLIPSPKIVLKKALLRKPYFDVSVNTVISNENEIFRRSVINFILSVIYIEIISHLFSSSRHLQYNDFILYPHISFRF